MDNPRGDLRRLAPPPPLFTFQSPLRPFPSISMQINGGYKTLIADIIGGKPTARNHRNEPGSDYRNFTHPFSMLQGSTGTRYKTLSPLPSRLINYHVGHILEKILRVNCGLET